MLSVITRITEFNSFQSCGFRLEYKTYSNMLRSSYSPRRKRLRVRNLPDNDKGTKIVETLSMY